MGRHALVLGTATYRADPKLAALPGVRRDVGELRTVLDTEGGFDSVEHHLDLPAAHMMQVVEEFYGARRTGDLAVFYYSGHGILYDDRESLFFGTIDTDTALLRRPWALRLGIRFGGPEAPPREPHRHHPR